MVQMTAAMAVKAKVQIAWSESVLNAIETPNMVTPAGRLKHKFLAGAVDNAELTPRRGNRARRLSPPGSCLR